MHAVGAPILSRTDNIRGAISIYGPSNRLLESGFEDELPKQILRAANIVELNINYQ
jgi:DNA-binding IclR family transcriptional regulator